MNTDYTNPVDTLNNSQKGAYFISVLKSYLIVNSAVVAVPEPDIGDDIWMAYTQFPHRIIPCQAKSIYTFQDIHPRKLPMRRYLTNIKFTNLEKTIEVDYSYFIGLYDKEEKPWQFHIACIPSDFFAKHWDFILYRLTKRKYGKQVNLNFEYNQKTNRYFLCGQSHLEVTEFFGNLDSSRKYFEGQPVLQ